MLIHLFGDKIVGIIEKLGSFDIQPKKRVILTSNLWNYLLSATTLRMKKGIYSTVSSRGKNV